MKDLKTYACYLKNEEELQQSTSGGVFYGIGRDFIKNGGIVFGVVMDENQRVYHTVAETVEELERMRGSKYVQSRIGDTYRYVRDALLKGKKVLFSGTPCQVAGLKTFLENRKDDRNLYCVEVICHGVPSQKLFDEYLDGIANMKPVCDYRFRNGSCGWDESHISYCIDGKVMLVKSGDDSYSYGFDEKYFLRKSCYQCRFKEEDSMADITIGDYWGIRNEHPDFYNRNGVSAVIIRNEKGEHLFEICRYQFACIESSFRKVSHANPALCSNNIDVLARKAFFHFRKRYGNLTEVYEAMEQSEIFCGIAVIGGYSSRLTVNRLRLKAPIVKLNWHMTNSTISSMVSPPVSTVKSEAVHCSNNYRRQSVIADIRKDLESRLSRTQHKNWLLIDFLEERYANYYFEDGSVMTDSEALEDSNLQLEATHISFLDLPVELWEQACLRYMELLKRYYEPERIILNCLYLTEWHGDEAHTLSFDNAMEIRKINARLEQCYTFFQEHMKGIHCISSAEEAEGYCSDSFVFGCQPMYYNYNKYDTLSEALRQIILEK